VGKEVSMVKVTMGRWGNNLAVRLPAEIVDAIKVRDGEQVEIEARDGQAITRRVRRPVSLEDLFRGKSPDEWRSDYAGAYEWGPMLAAKSSRNDGRLHTVRGRPDLD